jgi:hypothetical protein
MTDNKVKIDVSEFMDWRGNKITKIFHDDLVNHKKNTSESMENIPISKEGSEKAYWQFRGMLIVIDSLLAYMDDVSSVEELAEGINNEK